MKAPDFPVGDEVLLDRHNIHSKLPSQKLDHKKFGPFKVVKKIRSHAFRLELPAQWKVHDVFSVNLLEPYWKPKDPLRTIVPPEPEDIDDEENWLIKAIVDSRTVGRKKKVEYRVLWEGF
jgi:hypothetical protein